MWLDVELPVTVEEARDAPMVLVGGPTLREGSSQPFRSRHRLPMWRRRTDDMLAEAKAAILSGARGLRESH